jgi:hypothetical protein
VKLVQSRIGAVCESKAGTSTEALLGVVVEVAKSLSTFTLGVLGQLARKDELSAVERSVNMEGADMDASDNHQWRQRWDRMGSEKRGMPHTLSGYREPGEWPSSSSCRDHKRARQYGCRYLYVMLDIYS